MIDLKINDFGDFVLDDADLSVVKGRELDKQRAFEIAMSVKKDWLYDNIGANLEEHIGESVTSGLFKRIKKELATEIGNSTNYKTNEIYIDIAQQGFNLAIKIYLRREDGISADVIDLNLDLIRGVNIRLD